MVQTTCEGIRGFLTTLDIDSKMVADDQLSAFLGPDSKGRDLFLNIRIVESDLTEAIAASTESISTYHLMQFYIPLPFRIREARAKDVALKLFSINRRLELSGFEFSQPDGIIYFRYCLPVTNEFLEDPVFTSIIGTIEDSVHTFMDDIEVVSEGEARAH